MHKINIEGEVYGADIWVREEPYRERFVIGFQISGTSGETRANTDNCVIPRESIDDGLGNGSLEEYLRKVICRMTEMHIKEIVKAGDNQSHTTIRHWLKEAKREVDGDR